MSRKWKTLIVSGASLLAVVCATSVILIGHASSQSQQIKLQETTLTVTVPLLKNLSLQPEAARVNRRLSNRFKSGRGAESTLAGTLSLGANQQSVTIIRRQNDSGETVEVALAEQRLSWSDAEGLTAIRSATESERRLAERLVFDSVDQFVLAQLRGASYYTIVRNLRPDDAGENYSGPLWTLVRISEPKPKDMAQSPWRLYYINEFSDLIDRIVSELDGQKIEASIQWTENNGELIPSHIKWTTSGQTIMEFQVTTFSQNK
jgi:hypothetical protein